MSAVRRPSHARVFRITEPAWNDRNLCDLAAHISSPCVFAHIRASSGSPVQLTNCHPFRRGRWLWMHNGLIHGFAGMEHDLAMAVDPQMTVATTDGDSLYGFRYSSEGRWRSLFHSSNLATLRQQYPGNALLHDVSDDARLVVSEPLGDLRGAWREVPEYPRRGEPGPRPG